MSERQNIEGDIHTLEEKIDAWFQKHFGTLAPGTEAHKAALAAHADLKTIIGIIPSVPAA